MQVYVVAANQSDFEAWIDANVVLPDPTTYTYVDTARSIVGASMTSSTVIFTDMWDRHLEAPLIFRLVEVNIVRTEEQESL